MQFRPYMDELREIKTFLNYPKSIVIISHRNPDGDAIGSSLALQEYLQLNRHSVKTIFPSDYPPIFSFIEGVDSSIIYDHNQEAAVKAIEQADAIFCLDFNSLERIDKMAEHVYASKAKKFLIDHHLDPEPFADYVFSDTTASSTCELVFQFIEDLGETNKINPSIGASLLTGIITDTGSFKYSTNPRTYKVASKLKEAGVDDYFIQDKIFNSIEEKQLRILGHCLANRMEILPQFKAGIIHLTKQDYQDFKIQRGETEGIVNYLLMISGIEVAAFITDQPTIVKLSLRSKGDISVQKLANNHFNGGGHKNASGGAAYAKLEDVIARFKKVLPQYI